MNCGACGKTGLRTTRLAVVIGDGIPDRRRVCNECAADGVLLVAMKRPIVVDKAERKSIQETLAPFIRQIEVIRKGAKLSETNEVDGSPEGCFWGGKVEALEAVIALLKQGRT